MQTKKLYTVTIDNKDSDLLLELDKVAFDEYQCAGKIDFNLEEAEVDELIGKDAYCGGDIPEHVFEKLENQESNGQFVFTELDNLNAFQSYLNTIGYKFQVAQIEEEDWNETWRQNFKEINISDNLKVVPSWEKNNNKQHDIYIYPGMGFGTGNHETTFLCLKLYDQIKEELKEGHKCLDFGCGSGILGVAAIKLKKAIVDFVDIDSSALDNCVQNLELNDYQNYSSGHGVILRDRYRVNSYPLVFANILESVLIEEKNVLEESCGKGGKIIISGLLAGQEENIIKNYSIFQLKEKLTKGDWVALLMEKK